MTKTMLAALAICCTTAMGACPESEGKAKAQEVQVQKVSNDTKGDCALSCDGKSATVQKVADETKGDCSKSCDGTGASVQTVSDERKGDCSKSCDGDKGASVQKVAYADEACSKACPLDAAMPTMLMKVGNETTACSKTAEKMCDKTGAAMAYVVNDKEYHCSVEAKTAHHAAMTEYLDALTHVSYNVGGEHMECPVGASQACEKTGEAVKYQVGPMVFDNAEDAVRAAAMARGMMSQVAMTYEVAGEKTACSAQASEMASTCSSKSVAYVVNGKKTDCSQAAEYNLTEAKLMAAIEGVRYAVSQG